MNEVVVHSSFFYIMVTILLVVAELAYLRVASKFNIIDRPDRNSSHSYNVLRGGGIVFLIGAWMWDVCMGFGYLWFFIGLTLVAVVSFIDDIRSLPETVRLVIQFIAMGFVFYELDMLQINVYILCIAFVVCVGAVNIYNFMDGINGMTCCYSVSVLIPLIILNLRYEFIEQSFLFVVLLSVLVFCMFNFRQKDKAKCFAGDVGSVGIAFMLLFPIVKLVIKTGDLTWLAMLIVYGVDGCLTICHRMMLHENLGEAHRKHVYQLMANELGLSHITVSCIYMCLQLVISLSMIYFIPNVLTWHFVYLVTILMILVAGYVAFIKKYYYLHKGVNK